MSEQITDDELEACHKHALRALDALRVTRNVLRNNIEILSKAVDKVVKHEGTIVVLRAALHNAKRDCTQACFERSIGNEKFDCICGAVQHNDAIDAVLKETK